MIHRDSRVGKIMLLVTLLIALCVFMFMVSGCSSSGGGAAKEGTTVEKAAEEGTPAETTEGEAAKEAGTEEEGPATEQERIQNERLSDIKDIKQLFVDNCGACHANDGTGLIGPNIKDTKLSYAAIKTVVEKGRGSMPPFKGSELSDEQINRIADYVASGIK